LTDYPPTLPKTGIWDIIFFRLSGTLSSAGSALTSYLLLAQLFPLRLIASRAHQLIASRALSGSSAHCPSVGTLSSAGSAGLYLLLAQLSPLIFCWLSHCLSGSVPLGLISSLPLRLISSLPLGLISSLPLGLISSRLSRAHQLTPLGSAAIASRAPQLSPLGLSGCRLSGSAIASRAPQLSPLELISYRHSGSAAITSRAHQLLPLGRRS